MIVFITLMIDENCESYNYSIAPEGSVLDLVFEDQVLAVCSTE